MSAPVHAWLATPLDPAVRAAVDRLAGAPDVARIALMPDVHLAHDVCVGTVLATRSRLYPQAVGGDIGCGMAAVQLNTSAERLHDPACARRILDLLGRLAPPLARPPGAALPLPDDVAALPHSGAPAVRRALREARCQLGTLGRGNHFLELQRDDEDGLWVMVHSGSRGLGPTIRDHHLRHADPSPDGLPSLEAEADAGRAYLLDLALALAWAEANRAALLDVVAVVLDEVLGCAPRLETARSCQHNHVRLEGWPCGQVWVHRKGAIPAAEGEAGIIPGSMGSASYLTLGRGHPDALGSSSHGAGRALSRTEARRQITVRDLARQLHGVWYDDAHREALVEEAPAAYRDIGAVLAAQRALTRVTRRLRPVLCYKGA